MACQSRKLSTSSRHRDRGSSCVGFLSSLKQVIWSTLDNNCEENSEAESESDAASSSQATHEGSSDDELNQGISELSVESEGSEGDLGRGVQVEVCVDVRTSEESAADELLIGEQEYTFEDHQLVDMSHSPDFDSSPFFLDAGESNCAGRDENEADLADGDDDVR